MRVESSQARHASPVGSDVACSPRARWLAAGGALTLAVLATAFAVVRTPNAEVPNLSGRTLTFIAIGDWGRNGGYGQRPTAATLGAVAQNVSAAFIISVGDNFYDSGVVSEDDPQFNSSWRDVYTHPGLVSLPCECVVNAAAAEASGHARIPRQTVPAAASPPTARNTNPRRTQGSPSPETTTGEAGPPPCAGRWRTAATRGGAFRP